MLKAFKGVAAVKSALDSIKGTRHLERYTSKAKNGFIAWTGLLAFLIILVFVEKFTPAVYNTVHIALVMNNLNQLINTLQFIAAFNVLWGIEILLAIGLGRKKINSFNASQTESLPSNILMSPSQEEKVEPLADEDLAPSLKVKRSMPSEKLPRVRH